MTCRSAHFTIDLGAHPARNVLFLVHKGYVDSGRLIGDPETVPIVDETSHFTNNRSSYAAAITNACFAAAMVCSTSRSVCAAPKNAASNCEGGK